MFVFCCVSMLALHRLIISMAELTALDVLMGFILTVVVDLTFLSDNNCL